MPFDFTINQDEILFWTFNIVKALVVLVVAVIAGRLLHKWLINIGTRRSMNLNVLALLSTLIRLIVFILAVILILPAFGVEWTALLTLVGTIGLGISLAAQDLLRNFIAGIYILIEQPFKIHDKIKVETGSGVTGVVQSIELRVTSLRTDRGEQVVVPNSLIFSNVLVNLSAFDLRRQTMLMTLPAGSIAEISTKVADLLRPIPYVTNSPAPTVTVDALTSTQTKLEVVFWMPPAEVHNLPLVLNALRDAFPTAEIDVTA